MKRHTLIAPLPPMPPHPRYYLRAFDGRAWRTAGPPCPSVDEAEGLVREARQRQPWASRWAVFEGRTLIKATESPQGPFLWRAVPAQGTDPRMG